MEVDYSHTKNTYMTDTVKYSMHNVFSLFPLSIHPIFGDSEHN